MWDPEGLKRQQELCKTNALALLEEYGTALEGGDKEIIARARKKVCHAARMLGRRRTVLQRFGLTFPNGDVNAALIWTVTIGAAPDTPLQRLTVRGETVAFASEEQAAGFLDEHPKDPKCSYGIITIEGLARMQAEAKAAPPK